MKPDELLAYLDTLSIEPVDNRWAGSYVADGATLLTEIKQDDVQLTEELQSKTEPLVSIFDRQRGTEYEELLAANLDHTAKPNDPGVV